MKNNKSLQNLKPIQPGEIRNPAGRGNSPNRSTVVKRWMGIEEKIANPITGVIEKLSQEDLITLALIKKAREGDVQAYTRLMDSLYGSVKQIFTETAEPVTIVKLIPMQPGDNISDPIE